MLTTFAAYRITTADIERTTETIRSDPQVQRETAYYRETIGTISSAEDFLKDRRLFDYAMKAFGLEDMSYAKGLVRKILSEGNDSRDALVNRLNDPRYRELAAAFDFDTFGPTTTSRESVRNDVVDRYMRQTLEQREGDKNEGVRLALYFERKAPELKSVTGILADKALLKVVQTAYGLPASMSGLDLDRQIEMLETRIDIDDLRDPEKLNRTIERFSALWDAENGTGGQGAAILQLFSSPQVGLSGDMLMSLLSRKG